MEKKLMEVNKDQQNELEKKKEGQEVGVEIESQNKKMEEEEEEEVVVAVVPSTSSTTTTTPTTVNDDDVNIKKATLPHNLVISTSKLNISATPFHYQPKIIKDKEKEKGEEVKDIEESSRVPSLSTTTGSSNSNRTEVKQVNRRRKTTIPTPSTTTDSYSRPTRTIPSARSVPPITTNTTHHLHLPRHLTDSPLHYPLHPPINGDPAFTFLTDRENKLNPVYPPLSLGLPTQVQTEPELKNLKLTYRNLLPLLTSGYPKDRHRTLDTLIRIIHPLPPSSYGLKWLASQLFTPLPPPHHSSSPRSRENQLLPSSPGPDRINHRRDPRPPPSTSSTTTGGESYGINCHQPNIKRNFTSVLIPIVVGKVGGSNLSDSLGQLLAHLGSKLESHPRWFLTWYCNLYEMGLPTGPTTSIGWDHLTPTQLSRHRSLLRQWCRRTLHQFLTLVTTTNTTTWIEPHLPDFIKGICYLLDTHLETRKELMEWLDLITLLLPPHPQPNVKLFPPLLRTLIHLDIPHDDPIIRERVKGILIKFHRVWYDNGYITSATIRFLLGQVQYDFRTSPTASVKLNGVPRASLLAIRWLTLIVGSWNQLPPPLPIPPPLLDTILVTLRTTLHDTHVTLMDGVPLLTALKDPTPLESVSHWWRGEREILREISQWAPRQDHHLVDYVTVLRNQILASHLLTTPPHRNDLSDWVTTLERVLTPHPREPTVPLLKSLIPPTGPILSLRFKFPHHLLIQKTVIKLILTLLRRNPGVIPPSDGTPSPDPKPPSQLTLLGPMNDLLVEVTHCSYALFKEWLPFSPSPSSHRHPSTPFHHPLANDFVQQCLPSAASEQLLFLSSCFQSDPPPSSLPPSWQRADILAARTTLDPKKYSKWLMDLLIGDLHLLTHLALSHHLLMDRVFTTLALLLNHLLHRISPSNSVDPPLPSDLIHLVKTTLPPLLDELYQSITVSRHLPSQHATLYRDGLTEMGLEWLTQWLTSLPTPTPKGTLTPILSLIKRIGLPSHLPTLPSRARVMGLLVNRHGSHPDPTLRHTISSLLHDFLTPVPLRHLPTVGPSFTIDSLTRGTQDDNVTVRYRYGQSLIRLLPHLEVTSPHLPSMTEDLSSFLTEVQASPHTGSFQAHHLQTVLKELGLGEFLVGDTTDQSGEVTSTSGDRWPVTLFQSCYPDHPRWSQFDHHSPALMIWVGWEMARYCFLARLRTPLGGPAQTLETLARILDHLLVSPPSPPVTLLFLEWGYGLDKLITQSRRGQFATSLPNAPNATVAFFRTNWSICAPWFTTWRPKFVELATHRHLSSHVLHHGTRYLTEVIATPSSPPSPSIIIPTLYHLATAMMDLSIEDEIPNLLEWSRHHLQPTTPLDRSHKNLLEKFLGTCIHLQAHPDPVPELSALLTHHTHQFPEDSSPLITGLLVWVQSWSTIHSLSDKDEDHPILHSALTNLSEFDPTLLESSPSPSAPFPSLKFKLDCMVNPLSSRGVEGDLPLGDGDSPHLPISTSLTRFITDPTNLLLTPRQSSELLRPVATTLALLEPTLFMDSPPTSWSTIRPWFRVPQPTPGRLTQRQWQRRFHTLLPRCSSGESHPLPQLYGSLRALQSIGPPATYATCLAEFTTITPSLEGMTLTLKSSLATPPDPTTFPTHLTTLHEFLTQSPPALFPDDEGRLRSQCLRTILSHHQRCLIHPEFASPWQGILADATVLSSLATPTLSPSPFDTAGTPAQLLTSHCLTQLATTTYSKDTFTLAQYHDTWAPRTLQLLQGSLTTPTPFTEFPTIHEAFLLYQTGSPTPVTPDSFLTQLVTPIFQWSPPSDPIPTWASSSSRITWMKLLASLHDELITHARRALEYYCNTIHLAQSQDTTTTVLTSAVAIAGILYQMGKYLDPATCTPLLTRTTYSHAVWFQILPQLLAGLRHPHPTVADLFEALVGELVAVSVTTDLSFSLVTMANDHASERPPPPIVTRVQRLLRRVPPKCIGYDGLMEWQVSVREFQKIAILWDEQWTNLLTQLKSESTPLFQKAQAEVEWAEKSLFPSLQLTSLQATVHRGVLTPIITTLESLYQTTLGRGPTTIHETVFTTSYREVILRALQLLQDPHDPGKHREGWQQLMDLLQILRKRVLPHHNVRLTDISPWLANLTHRSLIIPGVPHYTSLHRIEDEVQVLPTKTKPKKLVMVATDGTRHPFLLKGADDLRVDSTIMQVMKLFNTVLHRKDPLLRTSVYSILPFGGEGGLIKWVEGATPLHLIYRHHQQYDRQAQTIQDQVYKATPTSSTQSTPIPTDTFWDQARVELTKLGLSPTLPRRSWPSNVHDAVYQSLVAATPPDILAREIMGVAVTPQHWVTLTRQLTRSLATMSMVGYALGVGDRHLGNILLDLKAGEWVHIDFNISFGRGAQLPLPELVPFRLTRNLHHTGLLGTHRHHFTTAATQVLTTLRQSRYLLRPLLTRLEYDSPHPWLVASPTYVQLQQVIDRQLVTYRCLLHRCTGLLPDLTTLHEATLTKLTRLKTRWPITTTPDNSTSLDPLLVSMKAFTTKLQTLDPHLPDLTQAATTPPCPPPLIDLRTLITTLTDQVKGCRHLTPTNDATLDRLIEVGRRQGEVIQALTRVAEIQWEPVCYTEGDLHRDLLTLPLTISDRLPPLPTTLSDHRHYLPTTSGYATLDPSPPPGPSPTHQVQKLILQATDPNHLNRMFEGWTPWI